MHKFLNSWFGKNWWALLVSVNIILVIFTVANPYIYNFQQKWRFIAPFSLHTENNFAVWWSGITLLLAALLAYQRACNDYKNKITWIILATLLAGLSLDEIGSFHERIGYSKGWAGIFPYGLLFICLITYVNIKLLQSKNTITSAKYLCIATALFFSVILQEYIEHNYAWKPWMLGLRVGLEEGTELLATAFTLLAVIYKKNEKLNLLSLLPKHITLVKLNWVVTIGLIAHIVGSYLMVKFGTPFFRGNPMNWYPTAMYFCIALICFNSMAHPNTQTKRKKWGLFAILSLVTSIAIMTNLFQIIIPNVGNVINPAIISENFLLIYIVQLLIFTILLFKIKQIKPFITIASLIVVIVLIWLDLYLENLWLRYTMLGALSCWTFYYFTNKLTD